MPRSSRVMSFMSAFAPPKSPTASEPPLDPPAHPYASNNKRSDVDMQTPQSSLQKLDQIVNASPSPTSAQQQRNRSDSRASRPMSMFQTYQPSIMDIAGDTIPELQPVFTFLNSHSNKLYQEGYFLKLHDLDSRGRPSADRTWTECFAQLVGTVLSLWDAAALDAAGEDGEVVPTFVNLSDASIKMIESLPMNGTAGGNLQNVLSISTAANNRYLLHFNSLNSLTQWTAGIRLAMYEHATLQEAYTGSLIAGKGKLLNNIRVIMERTKFKTEDWARVRFGAGTPWRRCWCVITPPDEKEYQKAQKTLRKKSAYDRKIKVPKGDIKFYDTRKITKKTAPIATISDAYAAYAIYPQSKPLIDQSTLVKLEGLVTIHTSPQTTTEGFVFVMPEVHPAVTGFEMMLRWMFPVFDTFALYGRPNRLIADTLDQRGLMFAMPQDRRYGYLDILDVSGLIHTEGSQAWSERQWRIELKKLTSHRMNSTDQTPQHIGRERRNTTSRTSLPSIGRGAVRFDEEEATHSSPATRRPSPVSRDDSTLAQTPKRVGTAPVAGQKGHGHQRSVSDALGYKRYQTETPSRLSYETGRDDYDEPPPPPAHGIPIGQTTVPTALVRAPSDPESPPGQSFEELKQAPPVTPVANPPAFLHTPNSKPSTRPYQSPELRRANSAMDAATLQQLADANRNDSQRDRGLDQYGRGPREEVAIDANSHSRMPADVFTHKGVVNQLGRDKGLPATPASRQPGGSGTRAAIDHTSEAPGPVPQHRNFPQPEGPLDIPVVTGARGIRDRTVSPSRSIVRKPVPSRVQSPLSDAEMNYPSSPSSIGGYSDQIIDADVLERVLQDSPRNGTMTSGTADTDSVDYASTKSRSPKKSFEKPRTGRLKTVGDATMTRSEVPSRSRSRLDTFHNDLEAERGGAIPSVDFGPTYLYKPNGRPTTSGTLTPGSLPTDGLEIGPRPPPHVSPIDTRRNSYFGGRGTASPNMTTPEEQRRSMAWQPSIPVQGEKPERESLTAEQWVQYRAALAAKPSPQPRTSSAASQNRPHVSSGPSARKPVGGTPPMSRNSSGDWTQQASRPSDSRKSSGDWTQSGPRPGVRRSSSGDWAQQMQHSSPQQPGRPTSRNAGTYLNNTVPAGGAQNAQPQNLSAREQMHVARVTGSPMINIPGKKQTNDSAPAYGLVGALEARQKEKEAMRSGIRSGVVQQAISARQQQQAQADMEAQRRSHYQTQQQVQQQAHAYYSQQQALANAPNVQQPFPENRQFDQRPPMQSQRSSQFYDQQQLTGTRGPTLGGQGFAQNGAWGNKGSQQTQGYRRSYYGGS